MATQKIAVTVTIEVDPENWIEVYGCKPADIQQDVVDYVTNALYVAPAIDSTGAIVTVRPAA
jgi:hypothetical protein